MPHRTLRTQLAACLVLLATLGADAIPAGKETTDRSGKVLLTLPAGWELSARAMAKAKPNVTLVLKYIGGEKGNLASMMTVIVSKSHETLDQGAAGILAAAKKLVPDQGDAGTISNGKVDGEESRVVIARTLILGKPAEKKTVFVYHNGQPYIFDFFCDDARFAADAPKADDVFGSIRWE